MASSPIVSWQTEGEKVEAVTFYWAPKSLCMVIMKLKMLAPWKESYDKARQHIRKQRYHFANKGPYSQS